MANTSTKLLVMAALMATAACSKKPPKDLPPPPPATNQSGAGDQSMNDGRTSGTTVPGSAADFRE